MASLAFPHATDPYRHLAEVVPLPAAKRPVPPPPSGAAAAGARAVHEHEEESA